MTGAGELTYASFPIDKVETDADGDLIVYGKASDGSIDSDQQIVDPSWMAHAAQAWKESGANLRVQHNAQRDPAGVGLEVETDAAGATWVKGLVVEPIAKKLVAKGALRAYSVGIARPTITRDAAARGGRITDGELVEISLVDRPANKRCGIQLVKSADDGTPEYVNEVFGAEADIAKALGADVTKGADDDMVNVDLPRGASISISPADFAKLRTFKQELVTKTAVATEKRDVDTAERRDLASDHNALPDGSYPIKNTGDLENAAVLARSGHGDVAAARRLIARRAGELGVANPLDESDSANKSEAIEPPDVALKEAEPDVTKDPEPEAADKPAKKAKKPKKAKKLPPWLNKPSGDDDCDDDKGSDGDTGACKQDHAHTEKCKTTPAEAAGLSGTHDMTCAPVPELLESPPMASTKGGPTPQSASGAGEAASMNPVPAHREPDGALNDPFEADAGISDGDAETPTRLEAGMMKSSPEVAAILRFKAAGMDIELGRIHDLTCPAYHPEDTQKCHPFADLSKIDADAFQREAVKAACGPDMDRAKSLNLAWQAAHTLKGTDAGVLNDYRLAAHKAFRDANPGPNSAPTPGMITPGKYNRPLVTDGHEAASAGHDGPNSSPQVATTAPDAHGFDRPPLSAGHQSPSPSHMKASFEYPDGTGRPQQLNYAVMEKERARHALMQMHEHLSRQFPEACPMDLDAPRVQPESRGVPPIAGIGKAEHVEAGVAALKEAAATGNAVPFATGTGVALPPAFKAPAEDLGTFADAEVYKGFKKMRKKLGKKVLAGSMTVDEARTKLGRQFAQKGTEPPAQDAAEVEKGLLSQDQIRELVGQIADGVTKAATPVAAEPVTLEAASFGADAIKAAVAEATTELKELLVKQQETFTTQLAEQQRVIDAIADQPDPSTAAFSGLAFNPVRKAARPAGVLSQSEIAERTQNMMIRHLQGQYNASSDPAEREATYGLLAKMRGYSEQ